MGSYVSFKLDDWENDLEHSLQINGFSLELVLRCALRLSGTEKALEQSLQMNGFSPECVY